MCYHSKSTGKVRWCRFAWILQEFTVVRFFRTQWKLCPGIGLLGAGQGAALDCCYGTSTSALPRRAGLRALPLLWCQKLLWDFPGFEGISTQSWWYKWGCLVCRISTGSLAGQAGVRCPMQAPSIAAADLVHAVCGPGTQSRGCISVSNYSLGQHWYTAKPQS